MILQSLEKIPLQHKKDLISNLVLAGGNTKIQNFSERLVQDVRFKTSLGFYLKGFS
jgi:actin-related protein